MAHNFNQLLTKEGRKLIERLSIAIRRRNSLDPLIEEYEITRFRGGSGGREVLSLPDSMVHDEFLGESDTETFFVLKVSGEPLPHNYREIKVWEKACELGLKHECLFAPIHAWDEEEYKWLIMQRATPVSPHRGDLAYLQSGQEYVYDQKAPDQMEGILNEKGWTVDDIEMNVGIIDGGICMMDYGGVNREENSIEAPEWI